MKKAQGSIEYIIIIAAVIGITSIVVLWVSGAFGGQSEQAGISSCKQAASQCFNAKVTGTPDYPCYECDDLCINSQGKDILSGEAGCGKACTLCKAGAVYNITAE